MAYYLGRDVAVVIKAADDIGVNAAGSALTADGSGNDFASTSGVTQTDLTGVDLGIGVVDEDITYMGSRTVLKAEIKKETTVSLTRKKNTNCWDGIFNLGGRWGTSSTAALNGDEQPTISDATSFGYEILITLKSGTEVFHVPNAQITGHTVTLNADGTTEETLEFISMETPTIGTT